MSLSNELNPHMEAQALIDKILDFSLVYPEACAFSTRKFLATSSGPTAFAHLEACLGRGSLPIIFDFLSPGRLKVIEEMSNSLFDLKVEERFKVALPFLARIHDEFFVDRLQQEAVSAFEKTIRQFSDLTHDELSENLPELEAEELGLITRLLSPEESLVFSSKISKEKRKAVFLAQFRLEKLPDSVLLRSTATLLKRLSSLLSEVQPAPPLEVKRALKAFTLAKTERVVAQAEKETVRTTLDDLKRQVLETYKSNYQSPHPDVSPPTPPPFKGAFLKKSL